MSEYSNPFTHPDSPDSNEGEPELSDRSEDRRGRVIFIADSSIDCDSLLDALQDATARSVTIVDNFFEAIGEIAATDMRSAPDAVIASVRSFGPRAPEYADAFRQADPSVAVLAIDISGNESEADDASREAVNSSVDATLTLPISRLEFERAVQTAGMSRRRPPQTASESTDPDQTAEEGMDAAEAEADATPNENPAEFAQRLVRERLESPEAMETPDLAGASATASPDAETINDVELLDRILRAPGALVSTLELALIGQSGCTDVRIHRDTVETEDAEVEEIRYGETLLGYLHAPSMDAHERSKYALWAGRYLATLDTLNHWKRLAYTDDLTGAMNRRYFHTVLDRTLHEARSIRTCLTILLFDIDDFKHFNDQYGHLAGDEILSEIVKLLQSVIRPTDRVCRIGGDEFVVIFFDPNGEREIGSSHPRDIEQIVSRFQEQIATHRFPKLGREAPGRLTISGGLATFPWDGHDASTLFEHADRAALEAKRSGKNAIVVGPSRPNT